MEKKAEKNPTEMREVWASIRQNYGILATQSIGESNENHLLYKKNTHCFLVEIRHNQLRCLKILSIPLFRGVVKYCFNRQLCQIFQCKDRRLSVDWSLDACYFSDQRA